MFPQRGRESLVSGSLTRARLNCIANKRETEVNDCLLVSITITQRRLSSTEVLQCSLLKELDRSLITKQSHSNAVHYEHVYSTKMSDNTKSLDRREDRYIQTKLITREHTHKIVSVHCQSLHVME